MHPPGIELVATRIPNCFLTTKQRFCLLAGAVFVLFSITENYSLHCTAFTAGCLRTTKRPAINGVNLGTIFPPRTIRFTKRKHQLRRMFTKHWMKRQNWRVIHDFLVQRIEFSYCVMCYRCILSRCILSCISIRDVVCCWFFQNWAKSLSFLYKSKEAIHLRYFLTALSELSINWKGLVGNNDRNNSLEISVA